MNTLIIILLIIILISIPFSVSINNNKVTITVLHIFKINQKINKIKSKINIKNIKKDIDNIFIYNKFIKILMKMIVVDKLNVNIQNNNPLLSAGIYNIVLYVNNMIHNSFNDVKENKLTVGLGENKITFEIIVNFRVIYFLIAYIISVKSILKRKGSVLKHESSNRRFIKNFNGQY